MLAYRPYRCQSCDAEKEILTENDGPCIDFCVSCSSTPDRNPDMAHSVSAFDSTRTLRPFECIESWIEADVDLDEDFAKHSPLFTDMSAWQVKRVIMLGDIRRLQPGEAIVTQGQMDEFMYVMLEGSARVMITNSGGAEVQAATINPGEVFGEVGPILRRPRTASVISDTAVRVFALDAAAIDRIGRFYPRIAFYIARNSARIVGIRFRGVNSELAEWKQFARDA